MFSIDKNGKQLCPHKENNLQLKNANTSAYQLWVVAAATGAF